tara:strand:- start:122 stop:496 length:375 start_codon:yes stop_codon:yes gene_type:complete
MKMFNIGLIKKLGVFLYCSLMVFLTLNNYNCPDDYRAICNNDKLIHFIQYFILVLLIVMAFKIEINVLNSIFLFIGIAALSFSLEFIQSYIPARDSTYLDSFYDILGALSGFLLLIWMRKCYKA